MSKTQIDDAVDLGNRAENIRARRLVDDANHWRSRAEEIRTEAELMRDSIARTTMLDTAASYETLASGIEERLRQVKQSKRRSKATPSRIE
jgi:hypothetical protein